MNGISENSNLTNGKEVFQSARSYIKKISFFVVCTIPIVGLIPHCFVTFWMERKTVNLSKEMQKEKQKENFAFIYRLGVASLIRSILTLAVVIALIAIDCFSFKISLLFFFSLLSFNILINLSNLKKFKKNLRNFMS